MRRSRLVPLLTLLAVLAAQACQSWWVPAAKVVPFRLCKGPYVEPDSEGICIPGTDSTAPSYPKKP